MKKKRAVSPIIAAILLIGLAVLAGAAIFTVVLPMLQSGTDSSQVKVDWSGSSTTVANRVNSTTISFSITVTNSGNAAFTVKLSSVQVSNSTLSSALSTVPNGLKASTGSANVVTDGVNVPVGQTVTISVTARYASDIGGTASIVVGLDAGSVGTVSHTFDNKVSF